MAMQRKGMTDKELEMFIQRLDDMPVKKKTFYSHREVAAVEKDRILKFMEEKGYSFQDVAEIMAYGDKGITGGTLASYLRGDQKQSGVKMKRKAAKAQITPTPPTVDSDKNVENSGLVDSREAANNELRAKFAKLGGGEDAGF